nr:F-box domain containing protein [Pandoravirus aubagnensis]
MQRPYSPTLGSGRRSVAAYGDYVNDDDGQEGMDLDIAYDDQQLQGGSLRNDANGRGLSALPDEVLLSILGYVPPSSLVEARRVSRGLRNVAGDALLQARREARARICPDETTCQKALACAVVLDDTDDLEAVLVSGVIPADFRIPQRAINSMVRLVDPGGSDHLASRDPWGALSRDSTPLALAVKAGSPDAARLLAQARIPPGDDPVRLITAAILSGGDVVEYDACGYTGSTPYPTTSMVDVLVEAFPGPSRLPDAGWVEQLPFGALENRSKQLAHGPVTITSRRADAVLYAVAESLGIQRENLFNVASIAGGAPPATDPLRSRIVGEGLLRFAQAMNALNIVDVARTLIAAGYVPEAEAQRLMGAIRNWIVPVAMMLRGNLSAGWSLLGGAGALPQLTARTTNAAGPALAIFGGEPLGLPGGIMAQPQLSGTPTPERVADILIDAVLWLVYNEPRD